MNISRVVNWIFKKGERGQDMFVFLVMDTFWTEILAHYVLFLKMENGVSGRVLHSRREEAELDLGYPLRPTVKSPYSLKKNLIGFSQ